MHIYDKIQNIYSLYKADKEQGRLYLYDAITDIIKVTMGKYGFKIDITDDLKNSIMLLLDEKICMGKGSLILRTLHGIKCHVGETQNWFIRVPINKIGSVMQCYYFDGNKELTGEGVGEDYGDNLGGLEDPKQENELQSIDTEITMDAVQDCVGKYMSDEQKMVMNIRFLGDSNIPLVTRYRYLCTKLKKRLDEVLDLEDSVIKLLRRYFNKHEKPNPKTIGRKLRSYKSLCDPIRNISSMPKKIQRSAVRSKGGTSVLNKSGGNVKGIPSKQEPL